MDRGTNYSPCSSIDKPLKGEEDRRVTCEVGRPCYADQYSHWLHAQREPLLRFS